MMILKKILSKSALARGETIFRHFSNCNKIGLLGLPFSEGQQKPGVCKGPNAIRNAGLVKKLQLSGNTVEDFGNLLPETSRNSQVDKDDYGMRGQENIGRYCKKVSEAVSQIGRAGNVCLTLGGDHSLGIGTLHGHMQNHPDLCVVWVDAHADINTTHTSESGNGHGMPLSFLINGLHSYNETHPAFDWVQPRLTAKDVVYIGLRDVDPMERFIMRKWGIKAYDMRDIDEYGIMRVVMLALDAIDPRRNRPVHVSFDIDVLDSTIAPSTGTSVPGGLTLREGLCIAEEICRSGNLVGLDLMEVNPDLGSPEDVRRTVAAAHHIIMGFLGSQRGGNIPIDIKAIPLPNSLERELIKQ